VNADTPAPTCNLTGREQPLPRAGARSVTAAVRALLDERERKGIATYGRSLETFNGRDCLRDLAEELIDAVQYTEQWRLERAALRQAIRDLLMSADCEWENKRLGHDWAEACDAARVLLAPATVVPP